MINFDVLGYWAPGQPRDLNIERNSTSRKLAEELISIIEKYTDTQVIENPSFGPGSDHRSFWNEGYTAVMFSEAGNYDEVNPYINGPNDKLEHIDRPFLYDNIKAAVAAAGYLALPLKKEF